ncbi:MAG TPA: IS256 family transposase [Candidatus Omnitrophota bacterium]|nr:IS256 family transposase [Candidatus Omnitrophota bacterium]
MNQTYNTLKHRWGRVKDFVNQIDPKDFWIDVNSYLRKLTKSLIEDTLDEEMIQYMRTQPYQRAGENRLDYRNGHYCRNLDTTFGPIERIAVPRSRRGLFRPSVFARYHRRQQTVDDLVCNVFLRGISTRDVAETLKPVLGTTISASGISRITKRLDSSVKEFHQRKLLDEYQFLFLDGIAISVKGSLKAKKILILVAYGITVFGKKELIAFTIANAESNAACEGFLNDLFKRGLEGRNLKMIVTDGSKGFINAIEIVYPHAKHQRCWVHKLRNATKYLKKDDIKPFKLDARNIYNASTHREAVATFKILRKHWYTVAPEAVACLERDMDELLAFLTIPIKEQFRVFIRRQIRTTNIIERSFREVRRRSRPMGCFTNYDSVSRIIYAIFNRLNSKWEEKPLKEFTQFI